MIFQILKNGESALKHDRHFKRAGQSCETKSVQWQIKHKTKSGGKFYLALNNFNDVEELRKDNSDLTGLFLNKFDGDAVWITGIDGLAAAVGASSHNYGFA